MIRTRMAVLTGLAVAAMLTTMAPATAAQDAILASNMRGTGENPPNASPATGSATVFVDADSNMVCVSFRFSGLVTPSTAGHIHEGAAGTNGGVKIPFPASGFGGSSARKFFCTGASGFTLAVGDTPAAFINRLTTTPSNFYVNIHTPTYPGGEIRGQLANA